MFAVACGSLNFFRRWTSSDNALVLATALHSAFQISSDISSGVLFDLDERVSSEPDLVSDAVPSSDSSLALVIRMTTTFLWPDVYSVLPLAFWPLLNLLTFCRRCDSEQVFWLFEDSDDLLLLGDVLVIGVLATC